MTARDDTAFNLDGELTAAQVAVIHRQTRSACKSGQIPERIDLGKVTRTDSSALGLLLEWQSCAHEQGRSIEFANPPESLQVLAGLSQVGELLGWGERVSEGPGPEQNQENMNSSESKDTQ